MTSINDHFRRHNSQFKIILGQHSPLNPSGHEEEFLVSKKLVHENFNHNNYHNDIAIVKLHRRVQFSRHIPVTKDYGKKVSGMLKSGGKRDITGTRTERVIRLAHGEMERHPSYTHTHTHGREECDLSFTHGGAECYLFV